MAQQQLMVVLVELIVELVLLVVVGQEILLPETMEIVAMPLAMVIAQVQQEQEEQ